MVPLAQATHIGAVAVAVSPLRHPVLQIVLLAVVLAVLALMRPIDHDESQYVAAAALSAHGWLPYRDYAYLQTPLQPLLFAPVAWLAGGWTWPALRLVNALCGTVAVVAVWRAARAGGATPAMATAGAALFAACDVLLFSTSTARNDALPVMLLALALAPVMRQSRGRGDARDAVIIGLLLAAATATKLSYAVPAIGYGMVAVIDRRHRPLWLAAGAAPVAALVLLLWALAPTAFVFDVITFPLHGPSEYYRAGGRAWKLGLGAKLVDLLKFLALGPALIALITAVRTRWRTRDGWALDALLIAGIVAAVLPTPTWRQYLLPILPPLFVRTAIAWSVSPPRARLVTALATFVIAGLVPSFMALRTTPPLWTALRDGEAARVALDGAGVMGPVATLSPQLLPPTGRLPDRRFATGPFYFRSLRLLPPKLEREAYLVSRGRVGAALDPDPPAAILAGGENPNSAGDPRLDAVLERYAIERGWRLVPIAGDRLRLYVRRRGAAR